MDRVKHLRFAAQERSYLAVLKKDIHALALDAGLPAARIADMDIVVAEIGSNLVKHARDGELLVKVDEHGIEIIGLDNGPGISDIRKMMEDGVSTTRTLGHGLGSIRRLSDYCDFYSQPGWGTIVLTRFYRKNAKPAPAPMQAEVRSLVIAKPGETACGDGVAMKMSGNKLKLMIGDGLGHGPEAEQVVVNAANAFVHASEVSPVELLRVVHNATRRSRGLVATAAVYDFAQKSWTVSGIGNISSWLGFPFSGKSIMPYNGIVGVSVPNSLGEYKAAHEYGQLLIMCSDGLRSRFELTRYPGILRHDLSILATALYKDYARRTDDMSVLIARITQKP